MYDLDEIQAKIFDDYETDDMDESEFDEDELALELMSAVDEDELSSILRKAIKYAPKVWPYVAPLVPIGYDMLRRRFWPNWPPPKKEFDDYGVDEMQYEIARRVVRMVRSAAGKAVKAARAGIPPSRAARRIVKAAVMRHAPGVLRRTYHHHRPYFRGFRHTYYQPRASAGRWIKRGRSLVALSAY